MHGRPERVLIPGTVVFLAAVLTLWVSAGLQKGPLEWLPFTTGQTVLGSLAILGAANVGVGYACHIIYTVVMLRIDSIRFIDLRRLFTAFGLHAQDVSRRVLRSNREDLLAEFHVRLHSHAPKSLLDHCSRRNSGWYTAQTSALALICGWLFALFVMVSKATGWSNLWSQLKNNDHLISFFVVSMAFVVLAVALWYQGKRWNREFWEVCWKWIAWDIITHPCGDWRDRMNKNLGVKRAPQPREKRQDG